MPRIPKPKNPAITKPNGSVLRWKEDVRDPYAAQTKGKAIGVSQLKREMKRRIDAYNMLADAIGRHEAGESLQSIGELYGYSASAVDGWLFRDKNPRVISPKRAKLHASQRTKIG